MIINMAAAMKLTYRNFGHFVRGKVNSVENIQQTNLSLKIKQNKLLVSVSRSIKFGNYTSSSDTKQKQFTNFPVHNVPQRSLHRSSDSLMNYTYLFLLQKQWITYIQARYCGALADRKCWKCDSKTNAETELFFCNCGVVQSVPSDLTYFQALGFTETFDIDLNKLSTLYKDLQVLLHPDKYSQRSEEERTLSVGQSAFINEAYTTLLKPLSRGLYLLELQGDPVEETNVSIDLEFLSEIMEVNEDISEATGHVEAIKDIDKINQARMSNCVRDISQAFHAGKTAIAKEQLIRLKYFANIDDKIKQLYRNDMET